MNFDLVDFLIALGIITFGLTTLGFSFLCDSKKHKDNIKFKIFSSLFSFITAFFVYLLWGYRDEISMFSFAGLIIFIFFGFFYLYKAISVKKNKKEREEK